MKRLLRLAVGNAVSNALMFVGSALLALAPKFSHHGEWWIDDGAMGNVARIRTHRLLDA